MQLFGVFVALLFRLLSNSWSKRQINSSNNIFQLLRPETRVAQQNSFVFVLCLLLHVNLLNK